SHSVPISASKWDSSPRGSSPIRRTLPITDAPAVLGPHRLLTNGTSAQKTARVGFSSVGLTDDQKAMLRLLAQREEGYEDMAALMGISVEEVREKVKEALAEVE